MVQDVVSITQLFPVSCSLSFRSPQGSIPHLCLHRALGEKPKETSAPDPARCETQQPFPAGASDTIWLEQQGINTVALMGKKNQSSLTPAGPQGLWLHTLSPGRATGTRRQWQSLAHPGNLSARPARAGEPCQQQLHRDTAQPEQLLFLLGQLLRAAHHTQMSVQCPQNEPSEHNAAGKVQG